MDPLWDHAGDGHAEPPKHRGSSAEISRMLRKHDHAPSVNATVSLSGRLWDRWGRVPGPRSDPQRNWLG
jgi:hypothetical protein